MRLYFTMTFCFLGACNEVVDETPPEDVILEDYKQAVCRIYVEEACTEALVACGQAFIAFESESDCLLTQAAIELQCPTIADALNGIPEDLAACTDELDALDCSEPLCDEVGDPIPLEAGACAPVAELVELECDTE